jgi:hypothetical protein
VFQVINSNTVKDRYLFLFNDLIFIAKPIMDESIMGGHTPSSMRSMSEDSMNGPKYGHGHKHRFRPNENSLFQVKNIVELSKVTLYVTRDYEPEPKSTHMAKSFYLLRERYIQSWLRHYANLNLTLIAQ